MNVHPNEAEWPLQTGRGGGLLSPDAPWGAKEELTN